MYDQDVTVSRPNRGEPDRLLTQAEAAERLNVSVHRVQELRFEGALPTVNLGYRSKRIPSRSVDKLIRDRTRR